MRPEFVNLSEILYLFHKCKILSLFASIGLIKSSPRWFIGGGQGGGQPHSDHKITFLMLPIYHQAILPPTTRPTPLYPPSSQTPHPPTPHPWALLGGGSASMNAYCIHSPEILQRPQISSFKTRNIPHTTEDKLQREILDV